MHCVKNVHLLISVISSSYGQVNVWGPFEKFVDWGRCAAVMQREA